jgi:EAL domain-containing protein (putative c-di-GMP-specific phosphodiesterase class I)
MTPTDHMQQASLISRVATADTLGPRLRQALSAMRVHLCSLHDDQGDVLWLSEGFMGPDEHSAVLQAYERFAHRDAPALAIDDLGNGRSAVVLRAQTVNNVFAGAAMVVVDSRNLGGEHAAAHFLTPEVTEILSEFAALRAPKVASPAAVPPRVLDENTSERVVDISASAIGRRLAMPVAASEVPPEIDRLFAALRRAEISLHVQRLVPLQLVDGVRRFEVLLRSTSSTGEDEAPHKMLEQATKAGLASMIDRRVVTTLLGWLVKHRIVGEGERTIFSVNLSATALRDEHFGRFLELCVEKSGLPRGTLAFEVDEQACLKNTAGFAALATLLHGLGCPVAIDDFSGTARSVDLLRIRGVRMLKFAHALTAEIRSDEINRAAIAGMVQMARVLGMHTVAKRVNDPESQKALAAMGVGFVQSFAASAPVTLESLCT